jgi:N-dimethylarginine dimethylaminohydrolase
MRSRVLFCLAVAALVVRAGPPAVRAVPDTAATWVWHLDPRMAELTAQTYEDLLRGIPADARVLVCVRHAREALSYRHVLNTADPRIRLVETGVPLSAWARDRYVFFTRDRVPHVLFPQTESVRAPWRGDLEVPQRLLRYFPALRLVETRLSLEGGNVLLTDDRVIVGESVLLDSRPAFDGDDAAVIAELERTFGRRALVIGDPATKAPHAHVDMFLSVVGPRTLLLGDPGLALEYFDTRDSLGIECTDIRGVGSFRRSTQTHCARVYARIAAQLEAEGFEVKRVPILHCDDGDDVITWNNAVVERRHGKLRAYVPNYGIPLLDRKANECWRRAGADVFSVRADLVILEGGAVRCLSNVFAPTP